MAQSPDLPADDFGIDLWDFAAVRSHKTGTTSDSWDGPANEARLPSPMSRATATAAYAWISADATGDQVNKADCRFIHHMVGQDGRPGAANTKACLTGIGVIHGGRGGTTIPSADQRGVYNHLASHLKDAGMSPPDFDTFADAPPTDTPAPADAPAAAPVPKDPVPEGTSYTAVWGDGPEWATFTPNPNQPNGQWDLMLVFRGATASVKGGQVAQAIVDKVQKLATGAGYTVEYAQHDPLPAGVKDGKVNLVLTEHRPDGASEPAPAAPAVTAAAVGIDALEDNGTRWRGVLVEEGIASGDGRTIEEGALSWRDLPLPLMLKTKNEGEGHEGADLAGRIETITREGRGLIGEGSFDSGEAGQRAQQLVKDGMLRGMSVDLDQVEIAWENEPPGPDAGLEEMLGFDPGMMIVTEARIMGVTVTPFPAFQEANIELIDGSPDVKEPVEAAVDPTAVTVGDRVVSSADGRAGEVVAVVMDPPILVVKPDDADGNELWPADSVDPESAPAAAPAPTDQAPTDQAPAAPVVASAGRRLVPLRARWNAPTGQDFALVANAGPVHPPATWFERPPEVVDPDTNRKIGYPVVVSKEGRVYGCVARWDDVHIGLPGRRTPPSSPSNYASFRTGQTLTEEGTLVATGRIVCNTVHPKLRENASDAAAWYADTGCAVADVAVYEDEIGIWVAGATRPDATPEQIRILRASDVSPDWRDVNGRLDCVGLLCVNASGFIVEGLVASAGMTSVTIRGAQGYTNAEGRVTALVAAGMVSRAHPLSDQVERRLGELEAMVASLTQRERPSRIAAARAALNDV